jgi:hypothetical protein
MATEGTPHQGLEYIASRTYGSHLSLVCYTNAADSLSDSSTYASLTQPATANGYAPITLDGTWSFTNGTVTYLKAGANPRWTATGTWGATVNGMAMVDIANGKLLHFRDNAVPFVAANLKKLEADITTLVSP